MWNCERVAIYLCDVPFMVQKFKLGHCHMLVGHQSMMRRVQVITMCFFGDRISWDLPLLIWNVGGSGLALGYVIWGNAKWKNGANGKDYADNAVLPQAQISSSILSNQPKKLVCIFRMISSVQPSLKGLVYRIGRCLQSIASQYKHAQLSSCLLHYVKVQITRKQKSPLDNNDHMGEKLV